jgi:2'-5' RNA ligase
MGHGRLLAAGAVMGHTVLAIPVPQLDAVVRERTAFYDPDFVSSDPRFVHAHMTVLAPWVSSPTDDDLDAIAAIARSTSPFEVHLSRVGEFPDGTIHLVPDPDRELRILTHRAAHAFPDHPPYDGRFTEAVPHLTLDRRSIDVSVESVRRSVAGMLPVTCVVDRIHLQWWANHDCRLLHEWPLGGAA